MCSSNISSNIAERHNCKTKKIFCGMATNILKHVFLLFRTYLDMLIDVVFGFLFDGRRKAIPDLEKKHNILTESAVTLAAKIRNKELTSEALVAACIERIKQVNPILNAVIDERFADALKDAKVTDERIAEGLPEEYFKEKPFLGVPFTAKESHAVAGLLNPLGIRARAYVRAHEDAECVRLLKQAGAIPLAVTNVPEINKWQETRNMLFGQTNNPYHTGRTTGGSSGGEAALAACYASPISLCSDIGGSTRMPAFYCGLFGLNPTAGHSSLKGSALRTGEHPTIASIGFLSKHCSDLAPLSQLVCTGIDFNKPVDIKNVKYFYTETAKDLRVSPISKELRQAMIRVVKKLSEDTSVPLHQYYHNGLEHMASLWRHAMTGEVDSFPALLANNQGEANGLLELAKKLVGVSQFTLAAIMKLLDEQVMPATDRKWADKLIKELADDLTAKLGSDGVLLFPSAPAVAPYHYSLLLRPYNFAYWGIFNAIKFPSLQVPLGLNSEGLPLGIQVVSTPGNEAVCLAVADHLAKLFGGFVPPCRVLD
ncbi:unnamed protein product [Chilo suppressalis]|uniref:Amidase domain-containing protein n=1 Tax=Chilo suppressalis TaxID=168631 RepID=A0ABN8B1R5_CHISP|nr:unnamed protein product [Chilo suppressalis]